MRWFRRRRRDMYVRLGDLPAKPVPFRRRWFRRNHWTNAEDVVWYPPIPSDMTVSWFGIYDRDGNLLSSGQIKPEGEFTIPTSDVFKPDT